MTVRKPKGLTRTVDRRKFLRHTAGIAAAIAASAAMPRYGLAAQRTVKVGFLAPLTGDVAAWGLPGRDGCLIWVDAVNAKGGIDIGGEKHTIEIISYDNEYAPDRALVGAKKLVLEDEVDFIMMLGGDTFAGVQKFVNQKKMLVSTLLPSDLSPDTPYLIAPCEVHPIYNVTGVEWLKENKPELKTVAMCAQEDALGLPSIATYRAAFEAAGIDIVYDKFFSDATTDFAPIVTAMLASKPDILCWDTAYEPFVHALTEQAFLQGFKGQIISCTADNYPAMVKKTSKEFMEGFIFQFPDFDDKALNDPRVNFENPNGFYEEYQKRFPDTWSAVSWEYSSILDLWSDAVEKAGTTDSVSVLAAMKAGGTGRHAFGEAKWWGKELFGIDNALVGDWPVVAIKDGKAVIQEYRSIPDWWDRHGDLLIKHMRELGQMWDQR
ncbi:ABC transporter, substrate-binding protein (cluster 4, leucine/isoleucine/valine/benzoate) [hydrothermal vent metagenome]|uniref:ABC transporter, substrate-binding protein (Cluster 4, leucine/isoleucine/valine/benzoate) n=1 Tax=hydrothermal vent metagenome TaxID=652676 RepID=A0A3B0SB82_9ZZZZ